MKWDDIWKLILGIVASVGGIGVIICFIVKFCTDIIADRLSKKYEIKMNKEIVNYKNKLEKRNYISKVRFDKEFEIYQELSEKFLDMTFTNYVLFPTYDEVPKDEKERLDLFNERYKNAVHAYNEANRIIKATAPFIPEEIYQLFSELRDSCCKQLGDYTIYVLDPEHDENISESIEDYRECWKRTRQILAKRDEMISKLRQYLSKLDVLE